MPVYWSQTFDNVNDDSFVELGTHKAKKRVVRKATLPKSLRLPNGQVVTDPADIAAALESNRLEAAEKAKPHKLPFDLTRLPVLKPSKGNVQSTISDNAAIRGDVIDVALTLGIARSVNYSTEVSNSLRSSLVSNGFQVLNLDDSGVNYLTGGILKLRVQINSNGYGNIQDAANVVRGIATNLGLGATDARAEFINKQRDDPNYQPERSINANDNKPSGSSDFLKSIEEFFKGLTSSPVTLAAIILGVVILTKE